MLGLTVLASVGLAAGSSTEAHKDNRQSLPKVVTPQADKVVIKGGGVIRTRSNHERMQARANRRDAKLARQDAAAHRRIEVREDAAAAEFAAERDAVEAQDEVVTEDVVMHDGTVEEVETSAKDVAVESLGVQRDAEIARLEAEIDRTDAAVDTRLDSIYARIDTLYDQQSACECTANQPAIDALNAQAGAVDRARQDRVDQLLDQITLVYNAYQARIDVLDGTAV